MRKMRMVVAVEVECNWEVVVIAAAVVWRTNGQLISDSVVVAAAVVEGDWCW